jgi:hypothetical protein
MALTGAPETVRTIVWVTGESPATLTSGWTSKDLEWLESGAEDPSEFYEDYILDLAATEPVYARIFVGTLDGEWVTRFDTHAARGVHTADPVFELGAHKSDLHLVIESGSPDSGGSSGSGWLFFPLATLGWGLRRRERSG